MQKAAEEAQKNPAGTAEKKDDGPVVHEAEEVKDNKEAK